MPSYSAHFNDFASVKNVEHLEDIIGISLIAKEVGKKISELKREDIETFKRSHNNEEFEKEIFEIANKYAILIEAKYAGVTTDNPSAEEISTAHDKYRKALLDQHIINKNEYLYD